VVGFPNYEVSDQGQVRNRSGHVLVQRNLTGGYSYVGLWRDGKNYQRRVHRVVLEAFVGPCPVGQEARHGSPDRSNNQLAHLCWGTKEQNNGADKERDHTTHRGEQNGNVKLAWVDVFEIRRLRSEGMSQRKRAARFGVTQALIYLIDHEKIWQYAPEEW
jgi:hypothetical protein